MSTFDVEAVRRLALTHRNHRPTNQELLISACDEIDRLRALIAPDLASLHVERDDIILLRDPHDAMDDEAFDQFMLSVHEDFPKNLVMVLGAGQSLETMSEAEAVNLLKAIADHQEMREHRELAGADE